MYIHDYLQPRDNLFSVACRYGANNITTNKIHTHMYTSELDYLVRISHFRLFLIHLIIKQNQEESFWSVECRRKNSRRLCSVNWTRILACIDGFQISQSYYRTSAILRLSHHSDFKIDIFRFAFFFKVTVLVEALKCTGKKRRWNSENARRISILQLWWPISKRKMAKGFKICSNLHVFFVTNQ